MQGGGGQGGGGVRGGGGGGGGGVILYQNQAKVSFSLLILVIKSIFMSGM